MTLMKIIHKFYIKESVNMHIKKINQNLDILIF